MSKYVPQDVTLTCSNGMMTSHLVVQNRQAKITGGKLWANNEDKPKEFGCKWIGFMVAVIAIVAVAAAPVTIGAAATLAVGAAVGVGASVGAGAIGFGICAFVTKSAQWEATHPNVKLEKKELLLDLSTLTCPMWGGKIFMFYNPAIAKKQAWAFATRNIVEIIGVAGIGTFAVTGISIITSAGIKSIQMGIFVGLATLNYQTSRRLDKPLDRLGSNVVDYFTPLNEGTESSEMSEYKNDTNFEFEEDTYPYNSTVTAMISDPAREYFDHKSGIEEVSTSRAEKRREYNAKPKPVKNNNGSFQRPKGEPKSLNHAAKLDPTNKSEYKAEAKKRASSKAFTKRHLWHNVKNGVKETIFVTAITWGIDLLSGFLQRNVDNNLWQEEKSKEMINVQAIEM